MTVRSEINRERWGTVEERAQLIANLLRSSDPMTAGQLQAATGFNNGAVGGALSYAAQRKWVVRQGRLWRSHPAMA